MINKKFLEINEELNHNKNKNIKNKFDLIESKINEPLHLSYFLVNSNLNYNRLKQLFSKNSENVSGFIFKILNNNLKNLKEEEILQLMEFFFFEDANNKEKEEQFFSNLNYHFSEESLEILINYIEEDVILKYQKNLDNFINLHYQEYEELWRFEKNIIKKVSQNKNFGNYIYKYINENTSEEILKNISKNAPFDEEYINFFLKNGKINRQDLFFNNKNVDYDSLMKIVKDTESLFGSTSTFKKDCLKNFKGIKYPIETLIENLENINRQTIIYSLSLESEENIIKFFKEVKFTRSHELQIRVILNLLSKHLTMESIRKGV